jgi:hypothetical protein
MLCVNRQQTPYTTLRFESRRFDQPISKLPFPVDREGLVSVHNGTLLDAILGPVK